MNPQNLVQVFENSAKVEKDRPCFRFVENEQWTSMNWNEVREKVMKIAGGLKKLGVKKATRVCILSKTRYEWTLIDLGILSSACVTVPIYESNIEDQVKFIIENSEAEVIFVENSLQYNKVKSVQKDLPQLKQIIYIDDISLKDKEDGIYSFDELMILGSDIGEEVYLDSVQNLKLHMDASFVYTSGTTGNPKGAILTHDNIMGELDAGMEVFHFEKYFESLIFLPLAHILARVVQFFQIRAGFIQCYAESVDKLLDNIAVVKPHFMASVPRIFEKIHMRTLQGVEASSDKKKKIFHWAMNIGNEYSRLILHKQKIPFGLNLKYKLAYKLVFSKLHTRLGGRIKFFISGGAPLSSDVSHFFHAFGFNILEGYGLTETSAAITLNELDSIQIGSVGKPVKGVEIKIADDGEIVVKGRLVFRGYYKDQNATEQALDSEGWFHTGDIGEFDEQGFLKITDRKKDIIVTAGGKNIAPQNIENIMKADPYISQFVVHGDKRKFLSALVTLDQLEIVKYAKNHHIPFNQYNELVSNEKVYDFIRARIAEKNKRLAKYETIKRFAILPKDFSVETGELTPTLKVKRKVISQRYQNIFDGFYK